MQREAGKAKKACPRKTQTRSVHFFRPLCLKDGVQKVVKVACDARQYQQSEVYLWVSIPDLCPQCLKGKLKKHGYYRRNVAGPGRNEVIRISVARLLCLFCWLTTSLLPSFAQPYRLVDTLRLEDHAVKGEDPKEPWLGLLRIYLRKIQAFLPRLFDWLRIHFIRPPPATRRDARSMIRWLVELRGSLSSATEHLINHLNICIFNRYKCHQRSLD